LKVRSGSGAEIATPGGGLGFAVHDTSDKPHEARANLASSRTAPAPPNGPTMICERSLRTIEGRFNLTVLQFCCVPL